MIKRNLLLFLFGVLFFACDWKPNSTYVTKYTYFYTKYDIINDSLAKELCKSEWILFRFSNRKFVNRKMVFDNTKEFIDENKSWRLKLNADSTIQAFNPINEGEWGIENKYFIEFDFFNYDSSNYLIGKFDVKLRYNDLIFSKGIYTSDTTSETIKYHFYRKE